MSVFISYNHKDNEFAERLALELTSRDIKVWKDSWRIGVGDSLIEKVQDGLEGARFFCVVFSKSSLASEWVKREITAGLLREIEERKVMILPLVIDDCKLPLLLRDKVYADFRGSFEEGMGKLLTVLLPHYRTLGAGRVTADDHYYVDWAIFPGEEDGHLVYEFDIVSFDREEPYSILTQVRFEATDGTTQEELGADSPAAVIDLILDACVAAFGRDPARVRLSPGTVRKAHFTLADKAGQVLFDAYSSLRIIGGMRKGAIVFNLGALFSQIASTRRS